MRCHTWYYFLFCWHTFKALTINKKKYVNTSYYLCLIILLSSWITFDSRNTTQHDNRKSWLSLGIIKQQIEIHVYHTYLQLQVYIVILLRNDFYRFSILWQKEWFCLYYFFSMCCILNAKRFWPKPSKMNDNIIVLFFLW